MNQLAALIVAVTLVGCSYANDPTKVPRSLIKTPNVTPRTLGFRTFIRCRRPR
jgi:hypothetical protein